MIAEPRRPVFWFLWPPVHEAVDGDFRQERLLRIPSRGPWCLLLLVSCSIGCVMAGTLALLSARSMSLLQMLGVGAAMATCLIFLLRGWTAGTYVNDDGYAIRRLLTTVTGRWEAGQQISQIESRTFLVRRDGSKVRTHISTRSLDLWLRPAAYDAAANQFERWAPPTC